MTSKDSESDSCHKSPNGLSSYSTPQIFACGTGKSIHMDVILPALLDTRFEIIFATCFWARSQTLDGLVYTLEQLSSKVVARKQKDRIRVYICFSSRSATQKLFHTSSPDGYVYPSDKWHKKLGLPPPEQLPGLDITVKSLFLRPFSVLHPKYVIIDRRRVLFPSCNVSWEDWYECVIWLTGEIVQHVFEFWNNVWRLAESNSGTLDSKSVEKKTTLETNCFTNTSLLSMQASRITLLPHPYNSSLQQALWFLPSDSAPLPKSPLNVTLLRLIAQAKTEVIILTPNFTSMPAFAAVAFALLHGVRVHIITNRRMMVPEQIATAGILTEQVVDRLIKEYRHKFSGHKMTRRLFRLQAFIGDFSANRPSDLGQLMISYFTPPQAGSSSQQDLNNNTLASLTFASGAGFAAHAEKSHIKLTLVDRKSVVLGSGNMDRASWRTSQELGILIESEDDDLPDVGSDVQKIWTEVEKGLEGRLESYFVA